ncbi:NEDD8-activating enzyme E1 catalytic subunit-like isoform 3-T5 [Polymixia lowei]
MVDTGTVLVTGMAGGTMSRSSWRDPAHSPILILSQVLSLYSSCWRHVRFWSLELEDLVVNCSKIWPFLGFALFMWLTWTLSTYPTSIGSSFSGPKMLDDQRQKWLPTLSTIVSLDVKSSLTLTRSKILMSLSTDISLLSYEDGVLDPSSIIPLIDGGTEGFKGNARVILPGMTACIDCTLELYPPQINFPMCTIASMPRLPEHCIEYARMLQWPKEKPFGDNALDGDNPEHIHWVFQRAQERAAEFNITGVTYRLTQGVVKRIIPAVASTNAVIAAACATEVFKIASSAYIPLNNYLVFNDVDGLYTYTFEAERKENCSACSQVPQDLQFPPSAKLQEVLEYLTENSSLQMKSPAITTTLEGKNKTLYLQSVKSIEERTRPNLCKTLKELGLSDGQELAVADITTPQTVLFKLNFTA